MAATWLPYFEFAWSNRAAPTAASACARSSRKSGPGFDGRIRCHYPLGDPDRNARIAADGLVDAKGVP
jgi:hypothetical protein